ncbi:MAG: hypothetical protein R3E39_20120 [Anaerolineae bacterium]
MQPNDIHVYYNRGREQNRLTHGGGLLEQERTREIIQRYLPRLPSLLWILVAVRASMRCGLPSWVVRFIWWI